jgi:hypothetical protein
VRNFLIEITAVDPTDNSTKVIRASSAHAGATGVYLDNKEWTPALINAPELNISYWSNGQPQPLDISFGNAVFALSAKLNNLAWPKYEYQGGLATIWVGTLGDPFTSYRQLWSGALGPLLRENDQTARIPLLGPEASLDRPLLSATYSGTGGANGTTELAGQWKPFALGACTNVEPVLIDPVKWIYQVHGYGACQVNFIYEGAISLGPASASASTYAALAALTLEDGEWAVAPSVGMFRLANEPTFKVSADIGSPVNVGVVAQSLILTAGVTAGRIDASVTNTPRSYSLYQKDQASILDLIRDAALAGSRFLIADATGKFHFAPMLSGKSPGVLSSKRDATPLVQPDKITQEATALPAYRVRVGHTRVWSVHSTNEIAGDFAGSAELDAINDKAEAAQEAAELAQAAANLANQRYSDMAADGVLDRPEKRRLIEELQGFTAERPGLLSEALNQGVTIERTAYSDAYDALFAYLDTLNPDYDDTTQETAITSAYVTNLVGYRVAKQNLVNAMANKAAQTANWTNVASRPTNLTGLNPAEGTKLTGIQTGATRNVARGAWVTNTAYDVGDMVQHNGSTYIVILAHTSSAAPPTANYTLVAEKGANGASPYAFLLSNEAHIVPADSAGNVTSYSGASTTVRIFYGNQDVTSSFTNTTSPNNPQGLLVVGAYPTFTVTGGMDSNEETAIYTFRVSGTGIHAGVILDRDFSLTKSRAGAPGSQGPAGSTGATGSTGSAGANAKLLFLTNSAQTVNVTADGSTLDPATGQNITFTANKQNTTAPVTWTIFDGAGNPHNAASHFFSSSNVGDTQTIPAANIVAIINHPQTVGQGSFKFMRVVATLTDGVTLSDTISIAKVAAGANGSQGPAGQAGANAKAIKITPSSGQVLVSSLGALSPTTGQDVTFGVEKQNTSAAITWYLSGNPNPYWNGDSWTPGAQGLLNVMNSQGVSSLIMEIRGFDGVSLVDKITISKVAKGRDAFQFRQDATPSGAIEGDSWYRPSFKDWFQFFGGQWIKSLGDVASQDKLSANFISVDSLSAINANVGLLRTAASGSRTEIEANQIRIFDASNIMRVRLGIW